MGLSVDVDYQGYDWQKFQSILFQVFFKCFVTVLVVPVELTRKHEMNCFPVFSKFDVTHIFSIEPLWLGTTYKSTFGAKKQTYTRKDKVNSNNWSPFSFWKAFYRSCTWISINADVYLNEETIFVFSLTECTAILDQVGHRMWTDRILFFSYWIYRFCSQFDKVVFQLFIDN